MELQTAQKNFVFQGVIGMALVGVGIVSAFDASFRRTTESIQEIWMVEFGVGFVACLMGLVFVGSAVRYLVHIDRIAEYSERKARHRSSQERRTRKARPKMEAGSSRDTTTEALEGVRLAAVKTGSL
jgi:hypothetical protein